MGPEEPNWQPSSAVAALTEMVADQLTDTRTALALLERARPSRPGAKILADADVAEILRVYAVMASDYEHLFAEQGRRWQQLNLNPARRRAVGAYVRLVEAHRRALAAILELAREIEPYTIEKILTKTDLELGIESLTNRYDPS